MGTHGDPWKPMGTHRNPMGTHGNPWGPMGPHGDPWGPMRNHGFPWVPMGPHGFPWDPMGSPWLPWKIQECRKSWILMKTIIRQDRKLETRGPNRCAMSFRSILSRQNPLNRHMEQNIFFLPKIQFFEFSAYWTDAAYQKKNAAHLD